MANNGIHEIPTKDTEGTTTHTGEVCISFHLLWLLQITVSVSIISFLKGWRVMVSVLKNKTLIVYFYSTDVISCLDSFFQLVIMHLHYNNNSHQVNLSDKYVKNISGTKRHSF